MGRDQARLVPDLRRPRSAPSHTPVTDARVQAIVERHRQHLERWFYPCSIAFHKTLGAMYVADPRFAANIDATAPGLAQFLSDAIAAS